MRYKIKYISLVIFIIVFGILYLSDNSILSSFAGKIEQDLIRPYKRQYLNEQLNSDISDDPIIDEYTQVPTPGQPTIKIIYVTPTPLATVSEQELWSALLLYRSSQQRPELQQSDALCVYARERVHELINRLQTNPEDPLDNHAGFSRDADSEYVFQKTGFTTVGENLAYTPRYSTATQIIEWGWDSSAGHRNLQLSTDITHGCISGEYPIYVGIYGK